MLFLVLRLTMQNIHNFIEQTNLKPTLTASDIDELVSQGLQYNFVGICLPTFWVKKARREIGNAALQLITVIGFPLGYQMTESKLFELDNAINNGADEIDMVMNISAFKSNMPWVKIEMAKCSKMAHENGKILKVIIETAYLNDQEILQACKLCQDAGADYVKTSTGFAPQGALTNHIQLIRDFLPESIGIKASGGIKNLEQAKQMIAAGAERIGTSSGVSIMNELSGK